MKEKALYIHVPFCKQKCFYCDFPSFSGSERFMLEYAKALGKEIEAVGDQRIGTIFIGGGTPTYFSLEAWNIIKKSLDTLKKSESLEFTVEGNPGTFEKEKLQLLRDMGVNRLSIGLQAWQDKHLKTLGRIHTLKQFQESFNMAREMGFKNINIDLMFGLPSQSAEDWMETLEKVTELNPEHLSTYSLIVEEGTVFFEKYEKGALQLPEEDLEREMWENTVRVLQQKGYAQYEISNFCKPQKECKHNLVYWNLGEYIGCGAGAHSYVNGARYKNIERIEEYIRMVNVENSAVIENYKNTKEDDIEEFMFMGLRKIEGISQSEFKERFNENLFSVYDKVLKKYINSGFLIAEKDKIFLSSRGLEVSNTILSEFILGK